MRLIETKLIVDPGYAWKLLDRGTVAHGTRLHDRLVESLADQMVVATLLEGKSPALRKSDPISRAQNVAAATDPRFKRQVGRAFKKYQKEMDKSNNTLKRKLVGLFDTYGSGRGRKPYWHFEQDATILLRNAHERAFELGLRAAGLSNPKKLIETDKTLGKRIESLVAGEMKYFEKMLNQMREGELRGSPAGRADRYVEAVYSSFDQGRVSGMPNVSLFHWHLESDEPCNDCKLIARFSPFTRATLPTVPKAGMTRCFNNCYCKLEVEPVTEQRMARTQRRHLSRREMINRIGRQQKKQMGRKLT